MDDKIKIQLIVAGKDYTLNLPSEKREDEELIRKAAKQINEKLKKYREIYSSVESERIIGMVALDFATERLREQRNNDTAPLTERVKELNKQLDDYFQEEG